MDRNGLNEYEYSYTDDERICPFWTQQIMYNETVCMLQNGLAQQHGEILAYLLFTPERILSVRDNTLQKEYKPGVDYVWEDGTNRLLRPEGSSIPYFYTGALMGLESEGAAGYVKSWDGSFDESGRCRLCGVLYSAGKFVYEKQIAVTYTYNPAQLPDKKIIHTAYQGSKLPRTAAKMRKHEPLDVLFYGSSSFQGADASGFHNRAPYQPILSHLFGSYLNDKVTNTNVVNLGVGGWSTSAGLAALKGEETFTTPNGVLQVKGRNGQKLGNRYQTLINSSRFDLIVIGFFAGNNYGIGLDAQRYEQDVKQMMQLFSTQNPDCEFLILTGMVTNPPDTYTPAYNQKAYEIAKEEHALVDMNRIHAKILETKDFISTSGNNINHGNDWLIRVTAQNLLWAVSEQYIQAHTG